MRCRFGTECSRFSLALTAAAIALSVLGCQTSFSSPTTKSPSPPAGSSPAAARVQTLSAFLPGIAPDITPFARTCARSRGHSTALTPAQCLAWTESGPVNVVIVDAGPQSVYQFLLTQARPRWHPAQGKWLVAEAATLGSGGGCLGGWHASRQQVELRLSPTSRRHFKLISLPCRTTGSDEVVIGDAHTDLWTPVCGDHVVDLDQARDQLVQSLASAEPGVQVSYRQAYPPGQSYPAGCGGQVTTDGRVAYVFLPTQRPAV